MVKEKHEEDPTNPCGHRYSERLKAFKEFPSSLCPACLLDRIKTKDVALREILSWTGPTIKVLEPDNKTVLIGRLRNIYKIVTHALKGKD